MHTLQFDAEPRVRGIGFGEAPRWHDGALWLSDIVRREVLRVAGDGTVTRVVATPGEPSGLGWLPDGSLLVVQMDEHVVLRVRDGQITTWARTAPLSRAKLNDMVVDARGNAFVSNLGFDYESEPPCSTNLVRIDASGAASVAAPDMWCPNGMAINARGDRLVVGQSASPEVIEFALAADGSLGERRVFGTLPAGAVSDGLCIDVAEALWIASPTTREFLRMERGGRITDRVATGERIAIACVLGGPERRTLFAITAATMSLRAAHGGAGGHIETVRVEVPGAGVP